MIVCVCRGVSEGAVRGAIEAGARSVDDVGCATGAGTCCGSCRPMVAAMLEGHLPSCPSARRCGGCSCGARAGAERDAA